LTARRRLGAPYKSDGVDSWWSAEDPVFAYGGPITKQQEKQTIVIIAQKSFQRMIERYP
jgi:hypothetical protein